MSFTKRLTAARAAYKKAQSQGTSKLDEGDYQIKVVKPQIIEPTKGAQEGFMVVTLPMVVAAGPDAGKKLQAKRYAILDAEDNPAASLDWFKTDLERMGLDADFDFSKIKTVLKSIDGMVFDCFVRDNPKNPNYQDCFINNPVDSLDDLNNEDEDEEEEDEEGEEVEVKKPAKKKAAKPKSKPKKKVVEEEEEEEEEEEDDLLTDEADEEEDEDEEWEEEDEDEEWED